MRTIIVLLLTTATLVAQPDTRPPQYRPQGTHFELGLAAYAKVLCSAVFVSGRDPKEASQHSGLFLMPSQDEALKATWNVDRERKLVRMSLNGVTREAGFYGDQGCIIHKGTPPYVHFKPVTVKTTLPDAASQPWPMGDAPAGNAASGGIDSAS